MSSNNKNRTRKLKNVAKPGQKFNRTTNTLNTLPYVPPEGYEFKVTREYGLGGADPRRNIEVLPISAPPAPPAPSAPPAPAPPAPAPPAPAPPAHTSVRFADLEESYLNKFGRPLSLDNPVYALSKGKEYTLSELMPSDGKAYEKIRIKNAEGNEIETFSGSVVKYNTSGKSKVENLKEMIKKLKEGMIVEYLNKYYVVETIQPVSEAYKDLNLFPVPYEQNGTTIYGKNPNGTYKTQLVRDYEVDIVPLDRLVAVKELLDKLPPNIKIDPELKTQIDDAYASKQKEPADCKQKLDSVSKNIESLLEKVAMSAPGEGDKGDKVGESEVEVGESEVEVGESSEVEVGESSEVEVGESEGEVGESSEVEVGEGSEGEGGESEGSESEGGEGTVVGATSKTPAPLTLPSTIEIQRMSIKQYKDLSDKNIPVFIENKPDIIIAMNSLACETILNNLGKLGPQEREWRKLLFIEPDNPFTSIQDVLPEQICFIILFTELLFTAIITDETIKTTQYDSFHDKYDAIKTFLEKTPLPQQGQLNALWNTIQEKYIQNEHRYIAFDDLKGMIIADPDHVNTYLEESLRLHNGEDLERSHITVPSGSATAFGGGGPMSHHGTVIPNNMTVRPEDP